MPAVEFSPVEFKDIYPQFGDFADARLEFFFDGACVLVNNSEKSIVPYDPPKDRTRKIILYALVCHACILEARGGGVVGALTSAAEGSVSSGFAPLNGPAAAAWYQQTQCGATAWQMLTPFMLGGRGYYGCFR